MRELIKNSIRDSAVEPYIRWVVKRSRGIPMPFGLVRNEIYDRQAADIIARVLKQDSNAIDIGCHKGQFLKLFLKHAPAGRHFAFEPIPHLAKNLKAEFPSVNVYNFALSNQAGTAKFFVIPDHPELSGLDARPFLEPGKERQEISIPTDRLDALIPRETKIDLIKIDVEGAEGPVIDGALDTIARNRPYIILESSDESSRLFGFSSGDIYDLIVGRCGLQVSLLKDWLYGRPPLSRGGFVNADDWYFLAHPPA
jgi:FkbM family methyltransferase